MLFLLCCARLSVYKHRNCFIQENLSDIQSLRCQVVTLLDLEI